MAQQGPQTPLVTQVLAELRAQGSLQFDDLRRAGYTGRTAITVLADDVKASQPVEDDGLFTTIWKKFAERV